MKKERTIHELLKVMLDNQEYFKKGLCHWIHTLRYMNVITPFEKKLLTDYVENNRPFNFYTLTGVGVGFYWKIGDITPRIKWLNKHIKKTSS